MAGAARPNIVNSKESKIIINKSFVRGHLGEIDVQNNCISLLDGISSKQSLYGAVIMLKKSGFKENFIDFTLEQKSNIWAISVSGYSDNGGITG